MLHLPSPHMFISENHFALVSSLGSELETLASRLAERERDPGGRFGGLPWLGAYRTSRAGCETRSRWRWRLRRRSRRRRQIRFARSVEQLDCLALISLCALLLPSPISPAAPRFWNRNSNRIDLGIAIRTEIFDWMVVTNSLVFSDRCLVELVFQN